MKSLKAFLDLLWMILRTILYEWILHFIRLCRLILERCRRKKQDRRQPRSVRKASRAPCVPISDPAYKRPDPLIYAQHYLMKQGLAVTWDNPDIEVRKNGVTVPSHELEKGTDYEIVARIWNNSTEAPVVGLPVQFSYMGFGAGTNGQYLGKTHINLGVKGGANHPAYASMPWRTPDQAGHYCIQVKFEWSDDLNPDNNLGQENTDVGIASSPATFTFALRNDTRIRQIYRFEADTYEIPPRDDCRPRNNSATAPEIKDYIAAVPPAHDRANYPVPKEWSIRYEPETPILKPEEEITIKVIVTPPDSFHGQKSFNVNAFHQQGMAGGVSLIVKRS
ncbi:MAG: hypothetical protein KDC34_04905 [Saprospiraceae bacterium]|nr:hypothetical protein [Saprospiraceae bacterium]